MATANTERGEVDLHVKRADGEIEKTYVLKLSINAAVALQKKLKKNMAQIVSGLQDLDFETIREIAFMLLQKHHKDEITNVEKAGDVIDDAGGFDKFFDAFRALTEANQPPSGLTAGAEASGAVNPPTAQSTTDSSTSTRVEPA